MRPWSLLVGVMILVGCGGGKTASPPGETTPREVVNLRAFARLYGVVRWFHPSDEAAELDWNRYAVHGVGRVRGAADRAALAAALRELVRPIGPTIRIAGARDPRPVVAELAPAITDDLEPVAWQHLGPGFDGGQQGTYESKRTHRKGWVSGAGGWGSFSQRVDVTAVRGKPVRLQAQLRAASGSQVGAWLRVDRPAKQTGFFDNMMDRAVTTATWQAGTITGEVAPDAEAVLVGGLVMGQEGWFDAFTLEVGDGKGGWTPVALADPEFDQAGKGWSVGTGSAPGGGQAFLLDVVAGARAGGPAAHVTAPRHELTEDLLADSPPPGELAEIDLGDDLRAYVPIALWSRKAGGTLPAGDRGPLDAALAALPEAIDPGVAAIADVIVAWNVYAHFYPYLDVIATPWHGYLDRALAAAVPVRDAAAGFTVVEQLVVAAEDGHGGVMPDPGAPLPLALEQVEGKVVVIASANPAVEPGDEVVSIDGVTAADALAAALAHESGSLHWRTDRAVSSIGRGALGSTATLSLRRAGAIVDVTVARGAAPAKFVYPPIGEVEPGIWLIDLSRAEPAELAAKAATLASARGMVFDLRGYPNGTHDVLSHLMDTPEHDRWMHIAQILRPNLPGRPPPVHGWTSVGWDMAPVAPRFTAKVAFMTGPGAISYAESVMGYVEALGLPIVGAATAGTNGNVQVVTLPSSRRFTLTGMKVTRHDGSRSHSLGIAPTVPAGRTIAGVTAGRDEVLERAIGVVKQ
jgi:hypothetical protein